MLATEKVICAAGNSNGSVVVTDKNVYMYGVYGAMLTRIDVTDSFADVGVAPSDIRWVSYTTWPSFLCNDNRSFVIAPHMYVINGTEHRVGII